MNCNTGCHTDINNPTVHEHIDQFIGTDFDIVKLVADNMQKLKDVAELIGTDIGSLFASIAKHLGHNIVGTFEQGCTINGPQEYVSHGNLIYHLNVDSFPYVVSPGSTPNSDFSLGYRGSVKDWNAFDTALLEYANLPLTGDEDHRGDSIRMAAFRKLGLPAAWVEGRYVHHQDQLLKFGKDIYEVLTVPAQMGKTPVGDPKFKRYNVRTDEITPNAVENIVRYLKEAKAAAQAASVSAVSAGNSEQQANISKDAAKVSADKAAISEANAKESELIAEASAKVAQTSAESVSADAQKAQENADIAKEAKETVLRNAAVIEGIHTDVEKWHSDSLNNVTIVAEQVAKANTAAISATQSAEVAKNAEDGAKAAIHEAELHKVAATMAATAAKEASDSAIQAYNNASASEQGALVSSHNATAAMEAAAKSAEAAKADADRAAVEVEDIHQNVVVAMQEAEKAKKSAEQAEAAKDGVTELMVAIEQARAEVATNASAAKASESIAETSAQSAVNSKDIAIQKASIATDASAAAIAAKSEAVNSASEASQASGAAEASKNAAMLSEINAQSYAERSEEIYQAFAKGAVYRGTWNPQAQQVYPDHESINSQWDVILNKGSLSFNWNNDVWYPGDRLIWDNGQNKFFHVQRAHGVTSVNNQSGAVTITPENIGALSNKGGIVSGEVTLAGEQDLPFGLTITAPVPVVKFNQIDTPETEVGSIGMDGDESDAPFVITPKDGIRRKIFHEGHKPTWEESGGSDYFTKATHQKGNAVKLTSGFPSLWLGDGKNAGFYPVRDKVGSIGANGFRFNHIWGDVLHSTTLKTDTVEAAVSITEAGQRVYSPNNKPTATDVKALPITGGVLEGGLTLTSKGAGDFGIDIISPNPTVTFTQLRPEQDDYAGYIGMEGNGKDAFYVRTPTTNGRSIVYHEQHKPTPQDIGALATSGGTVTGDLTVNGSVFLNTALKDLRLPANNRQILTVGGDASKSLYLGNSTNIDKIQLETSGEGKLYHYQSGVGAHTVYTTGNKPNLATLPGVANKALDSETLGGKPATAIISEARLGMLTADQVFTQQQSDERFLGIHAQADDSKLLNGRKDYYFPGNVPSKAELGIGNVPSNAFSTAAKSNNVVIRDASADVHARHFRSEAPNDNSSASFKQGFAVAFRNGDGLSTEKDNALRFCSDLGLFREKIYAAPRSLLEDLTKIIKVTGDANTYYPVRIPRTSGTNGNPAMRIMIGRPGNVDVPQGWGSISQVQAELTLTIEWNGEATSKHQVTNATQGSANPCGGLKQTSSDLLVWLRGNANYWITGDAGESVDAVPSTGAYQDSAGQVFNTRNASEASEGWNYEVLRKYSTRNGQLFDEGQRVYSPNNKPSLDDIGASSMFVKKAGDTMTGNLKLANSEFEIHHTVTRNRALGVRYYNAKGIIGLAGAQYQGNGTGITNYYFGKYDGVSTNPWIASAPECWLSIASNGVLHTAGKRIYHQGFKPTPTDIGALPVNKLNGTPVAAYYTTSQASATGTKIRLPFNTNSGKMVSFTVRVYQNYQTADVQFSGYLFSMDNQWYKPKAIMIAGSKSIAIKMGRDTDGRAYIWLESGAYRGIAVFDVVAGFNTADWNTGWEIIVSDDTPNTILDKTVQPNSTIDHTHTPASIGAIGKTGHQKITGDLTLERETLSTDGYGLTIKAKTPVVRFEQYQDSLQAFKSGYIGMSGNGNDALYVRTPSNSSRYRVYHEGNKPTPASIGALAKAGDTMTGALTLAGNNGIIMYGKRTLWSHNNGHVTLSAGSSTGDLYLGYKPDELYQTRYILLCADLKAGTANGPTIANVAGHVFDSGQRVYSPNNKPSAYDISTTETLSDGTTKTLQDKLVELAEENQTLKDRLDKLEALVASLAK